MRGRRNDYEVVDEDCFYKLSDNCWLADCQQKTVMTDKVGSAFSREGGYQHRLPAADRAPCTHESRLSVVCVRSSDGQDENFDAVFRTAGPRELIKIIG